MLLQKFPKQFLYCPRFFLKTVTKCASEISETLFIKLFQISLKDGQKILPECKLDCQPGAVRECRPAKAEKLIAHHPVIGNRYLPQTGKNRTFYN